MPYVPSEKTPEHIEKYNEDDRKVLDPLAKALAEGIAKVAKKYGYKGAFLGETNYALTRLFNHLPRELVKSGEAKSEIRYWMQAGIFGVLLDIALEYKFRVNQAYEYAQRVKSGDCYDTPYYSKLVEVVDKRGKHIGYVDIGMKRTDETLSQDVLTLKLKLQ